MFCSSEEGTLGEIEQAMIRIEEGAYGHCTECEGKVTKTRLNAIPYAKLCIKCAEKMEQG